MSEASKIRPGADWKPGSDREYSDIRYEVATPPGMDGVQIAKLTICRPEVRNAFRPQTLIELADAFDRAREDLSVGVIVLTGEGDQAFCSGGDQRVRGDTGYLAEDEAAKQGVGRFHVTDLQVQMRRLPKPIIAMVAGYAIGGGHVSARRLRPHHRGRQRSLRADRPKGRQLRRRIRIERAVPPGRAEEGEGDLVPLPAVRRAAGARHGPRQHGRPPRGSRGRDRAMVHRDAASVAVRAAVAQGELHADEDGLAGIQQLAHDTNLLFYGAAEAQEGREAYKAKRTPDFSQFPRRP